MVPAVLHATANAEQKLTVNQLLLNESLVPNTQFLSVWFLPESFRILLISWLTISAVIQLMATYTLYSLLY